MSEASKAVDAAKPLQRVAAVGDDVLLREGPSKHFRDGRDHPAKVTRIGRGNKIDLVTLDEDKPIVITSAPRDDLGRLADSWRFPD